MKLMNAYISYVNTVQINSQKSTLNLFLEEKPTLLSIFRKYQTAKMERLYVDKYSRIMVDSFSYSVREKLVKKIVKCKIYSNNITVFYDNEKVVHHKKNLGKIQCIIDISHYITTLTRKL